jgi:hypothetical protein
MLGKLFGSKARVKILKLFLSHPREKFYIRQIARDLKLQLNSVRRELENLEAFGLLVSNPGEAVPEELSSIEAYLLGEDAKNEKKSKTKAEPISKTEKKYFQVNTNFVLYNEIKELIIKAQILYERDFIDKLKKAGTTKLLIFTGYFVNDETTQVDILIVGRLNKPRLVKLIKDLEKDLGREVNFTFLTINEFKYRRDITDVFLYDILERKKLVVIDEFGLS